MRVPATLLVRELIRAVVLGTGQMGGEMIRLLLRKTGVELCGVYGRRRERAGLDVGTAVGIDRSVGIAIEADLGPLLERTQPHVVLQATCSRLADAEGEVVACLERGVSVISIAEELAWPAASSPAWADAMSRRAAQCGAVLLGTGVNPGFVLDFLILALTGVCAEVESIRARRVNDLSAFGPAVLRSQGVGLTPEAFEAGVARGSVVGHVGFPQSIGMIAASLGWTIDRVDEMRTPIVSSVRRDTPIAIVEPGQVAGCLHTAVAYRAGRPAIELFHPQQIQPEREGVETEDLIEISGTPTLRMGGRPEIPGGIATAALAVNMIPRVLATAPGLYSMADLPIPTAFMGDGASRFRDKAEGDSRV